jgi:hypothetical protein
VTPVARALTEELLTHHRAVCHRGRPPASCVIAYRVLCERAGYPEIVRIVGRFLRETAEWCERHDWPPINALAVNGNTQMPGENYDLAPGCSILRWDDEARQCIDFAEYPESVAVDA